MDAIDRQAKTKLAELAMRARSGNSSAITLAGRSFAARATHAGRVSYIVDGRRRSHNFAHWALSRAMRNRQQEESTQ